MRITRINLAGTLTRNGEGLPQAFACLHRKLDDDQITVEIIGPDGDETHRVAIGDRGAMAEMAERLQAKLDTSHGSAARRKFQVRQYLKVLSQFI